MTTTTQKIELLKMAMTFQPKSVGELKERYEEIIFILFAKHPDGK